MGGAGAGVDGGEEDELFLKKAGLGGIGTVGSKSSDARIFREQNNASILIKEN
jgi:hypothetical protein